MRARRLFLTLLLVGLALVNPELAPPVRAAELSPEEVASYVIRVSYDPETHLLEGEQLATYHNRTSEPIPDLVFHLYLNAFRNDETLWMRESYGGAREIPPEEAGWMEVDDVRLPDGTSLPVEPVDPDATLIRVALPEPVAPGEEVTVRMDFAAQMPKVIARTGWADEGRFVMAGQWFPKFGVWEEGLWDAYPFHANSEFYADFGAYEVALTLPEGWIVGATGQPVAEPATAEGVVTHFLAAEHVIDFAWAASPRFEELVGRSGEVDVRVLYPSGQAAPARRALAATVAALPLYEDWFVPYGYGLYDDLTVIITSAGGGAAGGMEYPKLFTVSGGIPTPACFRWTEIETVHELGHQWFQALVATNEALEPWLDEGFTDYSTVRAMDAIYGEGSLSSCLGWNFSYLATRRGEYLIDPETPMAGSAWDLRGDYVVATYSKPALALTTLERVVGDEAMDRFLGSYTERYAFAHPTAEEVRAVMAETLGEETATWFFEGLVHGSETLDDRVAVAENEGGGSRIVVTREGDLCIPTDVRVTYAEGAPVETGWPCDEPELSFERPAPYRLVDVDVDEAIVLDTDLVNDDLRSGPDLAAWLGLTVRLQRMIQDFFWGGATW